MKQSVFVVMFMTSMVLMMRKGAIGYALVTVANIVVEPSETLCGSYFRVSWFQIEKILILN